MKEPAIWFLINDGVVIVEPGNDDPFAGISELLVATWLLVFLGVVVVRLYLYYLFFLIGRPVDDTVPQYVIGCLNRVL